MAAAILGGQSSPLLLSLSRGTLVFSLPLEREKPSLTGFSQPDTGSETEMKWPHRLDWTVLVPRCVSVTHRGMYELLTPLLGQNTGWKQLKEGRV